MESAQTNLQLYRQLIEAAWDGESLGMIRRGYELALALFSDAYRSSRRPFVAHLVGTASTLATWGQAPNMVAAGLLHSAYMLGHFGDGKCDVTARRRKVVVAAIGVEAERLVHNYTLTKTEAELARWCENFEKLTDSEREMATLQLANLYDDCRDGEPIVAPTKQRALGLPWNAEGRQAVQLLALHAIGPIAAEALAERFRELDRFQLPDVLKNAGRHPRRVEAGVAELRQPGIGRCFGRLFRFGRKSRAA
jgi:hypothetical protein